MLIYRVVVNDRETGRLLDATTFDVGNGNEIINWLNDKGYIETDYKITITIHESAV